MAGFRSLARQVRDTRLADAQQRTSLRKCLERFAPYGHRATWNHLCERYGIAPDDRHPPQAKLVAALAELEEARAVWLDYEEEFAARRKREKFDGVRQPTTLDDWHRRTWGGCGIAWCDDPGAYPAGRLADVLRRLIAALASTPGDGCPVCEGTRLVWHDNLHHAPDAGPVCTGCGILVPPPVLSGRALVASKAARWEYQYASR
jgi:hypothetical protein